MSTTPCGAGAAKTVRNGSVTVGRSRLHVAEIGLAAAPSVLFLHGWPQSADAWLPVMHRAADAGFRGVVIDLPGIGRSTGAATDSSTNAIAEVVHGLVAALGLEDVTVVGHDLGGMTAYAYLRRFDDAARVVIMDVVNPGLPGTTMPGRTPRRLR